MLYTRTDNRQHAGAAEYDDVYELPEVQPQVKDKQGSPCYANASQRQKKLPPIPKRHLKPGAGASDIKLESNPSYGTSKYRNYWNCQNSS